MSRPDEARIGWHRVDVVSLVTGLLAVLVALTSLVDLGLDGDVVLPVVLVVGGLVGLLTGVRRTRRPDAG